VRRIIAISGAVLLTSCAEPTGPSRLASPELAVTSNTWIARADIPTTSRRWFAAASLSNAAGQSLVYIVAGLNSTGNRIGSNQVYNVASNSWSRKANLPTAIYATNGIGVIKGKLYLSGGYGANHDTRNELYMYDPNSDNWSAKASMPTWTYGGVSGVINDQLYVLTSCNDGDGCAPEAAKSVFYRYDPVTDLWTSLPLPTVGHELGMAGVIGQKFYVAGGRDGAFQGATRVLEVYDPVTNVWTTKAPMGNPRWGAAGTAVGGKLYVFGGEVDKADGSSSIVPTASVYNPSTNTWSTKTPMPSARHGIAAVRVALNDRPRAEVLGGERVGSNVAYIP
jgi:N-acetylneuraminic acid mutarotase